jgi:hypothetical protein
LDCIDVEGYLDGIGGECLVFSHEIALVGYIARVTASFLYVSHHEKTIDILIVSHQQLNSSS